jgi:hypothetical protein
LASLHHQLQAFVEIGQSLLAHLLLAIGTCDIIQDERLSLVIQAIVYLLDLLNLLVDFKG